MARKDSMIQSLTTSQKQEKLAQLANNIIVNVKTKQKILFQSLWMDSTVVILFLRRFGCILCQEDAKRISDIEEQLTLYDIRLVAIGFEWIGAEEFVQACHMKGELYIDSDTRQCYQALDFKQSLPTRRLDTLKKAFSPTYMRVAIHNTMKGKEGDDAQNGGVVIINKGGTDILYHRPQQSPTDHARNDAILRMLGILESLYLIDCDHIDKTGLLSPDLAKEMKETVKRKSLQERRMSMKRVIANPMATEETDSEQEQTEDSKQDKTDKSEQEEIDEVETLTCISATLLSK